MARISVNGDLVGGHTITIRNGKIEVDGKRVDLDLVGTCEKAGIVEIRVLEGSIGELVTDASVTCEQVTGNVDAGGSVTCQDVGGHVDAGGSVKCRDVQGYVDAGGSVTAAVVYGNIDAGGSVRVGAK